MVVPPRARPWFSLFGVILLPLLAGCPFEVTEEETANKSPNTFFDFAPGDTTFQNQAQFVWLGTDLDSDVVAYQYRLIETDSDYYFSAGQSGQVIRSLAPRAERRPTDQEQDPFLSDEGRGWVPRQTDRVETFVELEDGWYEFWARAIDARGAIDVTPAKKRFYVFFDDLAPDARIVNVPRCGRMTPGVTRYLFLIDAADSSRSSVTEREFLEYRVQLRATSQTACSQHLADSFTEWRRFPSDGLPVQIGNAPPTLYVDLFPPGCTWEFKLQVRDPARNIGADQCQITNPATQ